MKNAMRRTAALRVTFSISATCFMLEDCSEATFLMTEKAESIHSSGRSAALTATIFWRQRPFQNSRRVPGRWPSSLSRSLRITMRRGLQVGCGGTRMDKYKSALEMKGITDNSLYREKFVHS